MKSLASMAGVSWEAPQGYAWTAVEVSEDDASVADRDTRPRTAAWTRETWLSASHQADLQ